jgi:hypothetical protein
MIPGAREIYSAFPKVHLSLKMQKSGIINRWWFKDRKDVVHLIKGLRSETRGEDHVTIVKLFKIFTGNKYNEEEIVVGLKNAGRFGEKIQYTRRDYQTATQNRFENQQEKFYNDKIGPKLREIYEKREIPLFNSRTHSRIEFINRIIDEKNLKDVKEFNNDRRIWVFKFRDATGKLSLNFYSEKMHGRRRNRW